MSSIAEHSRKSATLQHPPANSQVADHKPELDHHDHDQVHGFEWLDVARVLFVALAAAAVWFQLWEPFHRVSVIGLAAALIGGYPIFKEAFENIIERRMTMELSMTIALVAALAIGEFFTALVITAFVLAAEILEGLTVGRGRRAIQDMLDFLPRVASVLRNGDFVEAETQSVTPGEIVLIRPGSRIPVDGEVVSGHSFVEQAAITGEPMPSEKSSGSEVYAGTMNQAGTLQVRATRLGKETTFGKIIEAVERAEHSRAPIQKMADRLAGYLVYFALGAAVLTFLITHNVRSTISVVIVAGACGIAAGTPLAILGAIGRAAHHGAIIKGGLHMEALAAIDTVLLDKTGTLTFGTPQIREIVSANGFMERDIVEAASIAEHKSEHPLAKAILGRAAELKLPYTEPEEFSYTPGKGVRVSSRGQEILVGSRSLLMEHGIRRVLPLDDDAADVASQIYVARAGQVLGAIRIADVLRPEAKHAVVEMRRMGLRVILLSGDSQGVATRVGNELGVDESIGELLPDEKANRVRQLRQEKRNVAMLGDGINDAPALVEANVGIAMGSGTDVARESADVVLIGSNLSKFVETLQIARRCRRIIMQNFAGTLAVDSIGIGMAAFGMLSPLLAAFIHVASELTFILNSTRLLPRSS